MPCLSRVCRGGGHLLKIPNRDGRAGGDHLLQVGAGLRRGTELVRDLASLADAIAQHVMPCSVVQPQAGGYWMMRVPGGAPGGRAELRTAVAGQNRFFHSAAVFIERPECELFPQPSACSPPPLLVCVSTRPTIRNYFVISTTSVSTS